MSLASQISALATRIGQEIKAIKAAYLLSSAYTASDVLAKIKTVDGTGSGLDADLLAGKYIAQITPSHSGSDFPNGTLVRTSIPATASSGASFIIEISGKSYSGNPPFLVIAQGYLYSDTIIAYSGITYGGDFHSYIKMFQDSGVLCFWWPRYSYWNSFQVHVRDAGGSIDNTVTSITDSVELTGTKKVQVNLVKAWNSSNFDPATKVDTGDSRLTNARPASDVSAWAKAGSKPGYNASEVGLGNVSNAAQVTTAYNSSLNSDTRNSRGVTRLYRNESDSDYSVQIYWTGTHWILQGYNGDTFHAGVRVLYADTAGSAPASDVSAWAKAGSKPSYAASEISQDASNRFITDSERTTWNGKIAAITKAMVEAVLTGTISTHSHNYEIAFSKNTAFNKNFGSASGEVCQGNDARLSDARPANGGSAANAATLAINNAANQSGCFQFMQFTGQNAAGDNPTGSWCQILKMNHGDGDTYYNRTLAFDFFSNEIYTRYRTGGTAFSFVRLWTEGNFDPATKVGTDDARLSDARPASDVSAWAKAGSKPSYGASEISQDASNRFITDAERLAWNANIATITKAMVEAVLTGNISSHYHAGYLTSVTNAMVEAVLTGEVTTHQHDMRYLMGINKSMVESVLTGAISTHTHAYEAAFSKNTAFNKNFGSASGEVCQGNDSRLSDQRTPTDTSVTYAKVANNLKTSASVSSTVDLSANGIGKIILSGNSAFTFTNFELNKSFLLIITANGYTPSFAVGAKHVPVVGNIAFDTSSVFYVNLTCIDATSGSEKLLTTVMKGA